MWPWKEVSIVEELELGAELLLKIRKYYVDIIGQVNVGFGENDYSCQESLRLEILET